MTLIKTISEQKEKIFDEKVNALLSEGYLIHSSNCWTGGSHEDGFFDMYQAILIREDPTPSGQEMFTLTASKEHLISTRYKQWVTAVKFRDDFVCRVCGSDSELDVHHIKPIQYYPELATKLDNGITLCLFCHKIVHGSNDPVSKLNEMLGGENEK